MLWADLLARLLRVPERTRNEAKAAAAIHDPLPNSDPTKTAAFLERRSTKFRAGLTPTREESTQRVFNAIHTQWHIWGSEPLEEPSTHNRLNWILCLANYLASTKDLYLSADAKSRPILKELLERPFPNPHNTYFPILDEDAALCRELEGLTGVKKFSALDRKEKRVLAVAYSLLPLFILNQGEAKNREQVLLNDKRAELKAALMETLRVFKSERAPRQISVPALANLICRSRETRIYTYDDVQDDLTRKVEPRAKTWVTPQRRDAEFPAFARDLQQVMLNEFSGEFMPEVEQGFRARINKGRRSEIGPIWEKVILWMVKKAKSLKAEDLYHTFWESLNTHGQKTRFVALLESASQNNFEILTIRTLEETLQAAGIQPDKIEQVLQNLSSSPVAGREKSLKDVKTVLYNYGIKKRAIEDIIERLTALRPQDKYRNATEINAVLLEVLGTKSKPLRIVLRELFGNDLKETETLVQKINRVLREADIDFEQRRGIAGQVKKVLEQKTNKILAEMRELFREVSFPQRKTIREFRAAASVLYAETGKLERQEIRSYLQTRHGFSWRTTEELEIISLAKAAKEAKKIIVSGRRDLAGVLGTAMVVEALRQEGKEVSYLLTDKHCPVIEATSDALVINLEDPNIAFDLARAINPTPGLNRLDLATLQIFAAPSEMSTTEKERAFWGLQLLNTLNRNIGLDTLLEVKDLKRNLIDEEIVGFQIMPVLSAGCQQGEAEKVVELLLADNKITALARIEELMRLETEIVSANNHSAETNNEPLRPVAYLHPELVSLELAALISTVSGPFKANHETGSTNKPLFLFPKVELGNWVPVGKFRSHRALQAVRAGKAYPVFARRSNNPEVGRLLFENHGKEVDIVVEGGRYRRDGILIPNLQLVDFKGRYS